MYCYIALIFVSQKTCMYYLFILIMTKVSLHKQVHSRNVNIAVVHNGYKGMRAAVVKEKRLWILVNASLPLVQFSSYHGLIHNKHQTACQWFWLTNPIIHRHQGHEEWISLKHLIFIFPSARPKGKKRPNFLGVKNGPNANLFLLEMTVIYKTAAFTSELWVCLYFLLSYLI